MVKEAYGGISSNGRALALHARGRGIDALILHLLFSYWKTVMAAWSSGMILALGASGRGFDSPSGPILVWKI